MTMTPDSPLKLARQSRAAHSAATLLLELLEGPLPCPLRVEVADTFNRVRIILEPARADAGEATEAAATAAASSPSTVGQPLQPQSLPPCRHSIDYCSVVWYGVDYRFRRLQAAAVKVLWEALQEGVPELSGHTVLAEIESDCSRFRDVFHGHPAWGKMIVKGECRGSYRLAGTP